MNEALKTELKAQLESLKARKNALLTKRERQQLERTQMLLERVYERRCKALDIEPGYGDEDDDPIAWPAKVAEVKVSVLLEGDQLERESIGREVDGLRNRVWLAGAGTDDWLRALRGAKP